MQFCIFIIFSLFEFVFIAILRQKYVFDFAFKNIFLRSVRFLSSDIRFFLNSISYLSFSLKAFIYLQYFYYKTRFFQSSMFQVLLFPKCTDIIEMFKIIFGILFPLILLNHHLYFIITDYFVFKCKTSKMSFYRFFLLALTSNNIVLINSLFFLYL